MTIERQLTPKEKVSEIINKLELVDRFDFSYKKNNQGKRMAYVNLYHGSHVSSIQIYQIINGSLPKLYKQHVQDNEALRIGNEFLINPSIIKSRNGSSIGRFLIGLNKHDKSEYKVLVSKVVKGQSNSKHRIHSENSEIKEKLIKLGFSVENVDLLESDPTFHLDYKGYKCTTSARTIKQGSLPSIIKYYNKYEEYKEEAISEGYEGVYIEVIPEGSVIHLSKEGNNEAYPLASFSRGHRPFKQNGFRKEIPSFIYLLSSDCGRFMKVGVTKNVDRRLIEISRQVDFSLSVCLKVSLPGEKALEVESKVIRRFENAGLITKDKGCKSREWLFYDGSAVDFILGKINPK